LGGVGVARQPVESVHKRNRRVWEDPPKKKKKRKKKKKKKKKKKNQFKTTLKEEFPDLVGVRRNSKSKTSRGKSAKRGDSNLGRPGGEE